MPLVIVKLKYFHHIIFQNIDTDNGPYGLKCDIYRYLGIPPNRQVFDSFKISDGKWENWMVEKIQTGMTIHLTANYEM